MKTRAPFLLGTILALLAILLVPRRLHDPEPAFEPPAVLEEPVPDATEEPPPEPITEPPLSVPAEDEVPEEARFVEGYARDEDGNGIPGVKVTEERRMEPRPWIRALGRLQPSIGAQITSSTEPRGRSTETGDDGHYRLKKLAREAVVIKFRHERYHTVWLSKYALGSTDADVVMKLRGTISGVVLDKATDEPITHFTIAVGFRFRSRPGGLSGRTSGQFGEPEEFWSETGEFTLTPDPLGTVVLRASGWGYAKEEIFPVEVRSGEETRGVVFRLSSGARIRGTVVAATDSEPVAGAEVLFRSTPAPERARGVRAVTGEDGSFFIVDLVAGEYLIVVQHPNFAPSPRTSVIVGEGEEEQLTIALQSGEAIDGYVTVNGEPAPGLKVECTNRRKSAVTDSEGYYRLDHLAADTYHLTVTQDKNTQWANVEVELDRTSRQDFEFEIGEAGIEGYVTLNGERVESARVEVQGTSAPMGQKRRQTSTDEEGYYEMEGLAADTYAVSARGQGLRQGTLVEVAEGEVARADLDIAVGTATIHGTVSWPEPYMTPFVALRDASHTETWRMFDDAAFLHQVIITAPCDDEGRFEIPRLPEGSYNVTAVSWARAEDGVSVDVIETSQIVTVERDEVVEVNLNL